MIEFDKYRKLGAYHWSQYQRPTIYRDYVNGLRDWIELGHILDVGAGDGLIAHVIGAQGVEKDETAVALAQARGADVVHGDAYALPFQDETFAAVLMGDVIEHLAHPLDALREAHRVLCDGGTLYVTTPPAAEPVRPYHYREYTPVQLVETVEPSGFELIEPTFTRHERIHAKFRRTDAVR